MCVCKLNSHSHKLFECRHKNAENEMCVFSNEFHKFMTAFYNDNNNSANNNNNHNNYNNKKQFNVSRILYIFGVRKQ